MLESLLIKLIWIYWYMYMHLGKSKKHLSSDGFATIWQILFLKYQSENRITLCHPAILKWHKMINHTESANIVIAHDHANANTKYESGL